MLDLDILLFPQKVTLADRDKNSGLEDDELMIAAGPMWAGIAENRDKLTKCIKTAQLAQNDLGSTNISPHTQFHPNWMKNIVVKEIFY